MKKGIWSILTTGMKRWRASWRQERMSGNLAPESIAMLKFIRDHYKAYNFFPIVNSICRNIRAPKDCVAETVLQPAHRMEDSWTPPS